MLFKTNFYLPKQAMFNIFFFFQTSAMLSPPEINEQRIKIASLLTVLLTEALYAVRCYR